MCTEIDWDRVWQEDFSAVKEVFHACLEVRSSPESGRGVWAAGPLRVGELLVAERALGISPEAELGPTLAKMQSDLDPRNVQAAAFACLVPQTRQRVCTLSPEPLVVSFKSPDPPGPAGLETAEPDV